VAKGVVKELLTTMFISAPQMNVPNVVVMGKMNTTLQIYQRFLVCRTITLLDVAKPFEKKLSTSDLKVDLNRLFLDKGHVKKYIFYPC
jgi:hypothetical protein